VDSCENGNDVALGFMKGEEFRDSPNDCYRLQKDLTPWS